MTQRPSIHGHRQWLIAGVLAGCLWPAGARAQSSSDWPVTLSASFDVANAYVLRGINQDDTGVIMWPAADLGVVVKGGDSSGTGRMTLNVGTWNSLHTGAAGLDGLGKLWYRVRFLRDVRRRCRGRAEGQCGLCGAYQPERCVSQHDRAGVHGGRAGVLGGPVRARGRGVARPVGRRPREGPVSRVGRAAHVRAGCYVGGSGQGRFEPGGLLRRTAWG